MYQENLDSFLAIAEELQLKGLMGKAVENVNNPAGDEQLEFKMSKPIPKPTISNGGRAQRTVQNTNGAETNNTVALPSQFSGDLEELEERVKSMIEKSQNNCANRKEKASICKVCGKEGQGIAIKNHIEAKHLEGIVLPCNHCEKTFRTRIGLRWHKSNFHLQSA